MAEGDLPIFTVPTTPTAIPSNSSVWSEFFGDPTEQSYFITDLRERHTAVILQTGQDFFWLKRMQSGTVCPYWDDQSGNCPDALNPQSTCFNTKFIGGYHQPLLIKVALPTASRQIVSQEAGQLKMQNMRPWTLWSPVLTNRDMIVKSNTGERYEVLNVSESGPHRGMIITQFFDVRLMQSGVDLGMNVSIPMVNR